MAIWDSKLTNVVLESPVELFKDDVMFTTTTCLCRKPVWCKIRSPLFYLLTLYKMQRCGREIVMFCVQSKYSLIHAMSLLVAAVVP